MSASSDLAIDRPSIATLWRSVLPTAAEEARARRRLHRKAVVIGFVLVVSYAVLVISNWALPVRLAGAVGVVVAVVAVANVVVAAVMATVAVVTTVAVPRKLAKS